MKKLALILSFLFCYAASFAQFPISQSQGAPTTQVYSRGGYGSDSGFVYRTNFTDTVAANGGFLKNIPGITIRTGNQLWIRNQATTAWIQVGSSSVNIYNSDGILTGDRRLSGELNYGLSFDSLTNFFVNGTGTYDANPILSIIPSTGTGVLGYQAGGPKISVDASTSEMVFQNMNTSNTLFQFGGYSAANDGDVLYLADKTTGQVGWKAAETTDSLFGVQDNLQSADRLFNQNGFKFHASGAALGGEWIIGDSISTSTSRLQVSTGTIKRPQFSVGNFISNNAIASFAFNDTTEASGSASAAAVRPYGFLMSRRITTNHTPVTLQSKWGLYSGLELRARAGDSIALRPANSDLYNAMVSDLGFQGRADSPGRKVVHSGVFETDAVSAILGELDLTTSVGNNFRLRGDYAAITGFIRDVNNPGGDSLDRFYNFLATGAGSLGPYIGKAINFRGGVISTFIDTLIGVYINGGGNVMGYNYLESPLFVGKRDDQGSNNQTPVSSAIFQIESKNKVALLPRFPYGTGFAAVSSPPNGGIIFVRDSANYFFYDSVAATWRAFYNSGSGGGGTPAGNQGNIQIKNGSAFGTPSSDSLTFTATGLSVKGTITSSALTSGRVTLNGTSGVLADDANFTWSTGQGVVISGSSAGLTQPPVFVQNTNSNDATSLFFFGSPNLGSTNSVYGFYGKAAGSLNAIYQYFRWVGNSSTSNRFGIGWSGGSEQITLLASGNIGIGTVAPGAKLEVLSTTEQLRASYDGSNRMTTTVSSTGSTTFDLAGTSPTFLFSKSIGVNTTVTSANSLKVGGSAFTGAGAFFDPSISPGAGNDANVVSIAGTIVEAGSGNHSDLSGTIFNVPTITGGAATATNAQTVLIAGPTTATVAERNWALRVVSGETLVGGSTSLGATVSSDGTLSLDATYTVYVASGTTTTWTLPAIASTVGRYYIIKNRGSGAITLNSNAGGNEIYTSSAVNTTSIAAGASIQIVNDGTYFVVID